MKANDFIKEKKKKLTKIHGEHILPIGYACDLMEQFATQRNSELLSMVIKLKEICEMEIPEFNIPELNDIIDNSIS